MNFKKAAEKLEQFLQEEIVSNHQLVLLSDTSLVYNNFIIKKNCNKQWELKRQNGHVLDTFYLKSTAINAAKFYDKNNFKYYSEIKILDSAYAKYTAESDRFKARYKATKDIELRDLYVARYSEAKAHADYAKRQIVNQFKTVF